MTIRSPARLCRVFRPRGWRGVALWLSVVMVIALGGIVIGAGFFDRDPVRVFGFSGGHKRVAAVFFSGDMGLRFGMGPYVASGLASAGVPVFGVSSSTAFVTHHSRAETDEIVSGAIRDTLRRTGASRIVVLGQSFGADIVRVGLAHLPDDLRDKVKAAVLVVPGEAAYFRADPTGLSYHGTPDAGPSEASQLGWLALVCIRGEAETDSLCPTLTMPNVRRLTLPGGHFLRNDHDLLVRTVLQSLRPILSH